MKASRVLQLQDWVNANRTWIRSEENPSMKEVRVRAETELGYSCPEGNIKDCFEYHEIPIRRSKADAKVIELESRCELYRRALLKVAAYVNLPEHLREELRSVLNIDDEVLVALRIHDDAKQKMPTRSAFS